MLNFDLQNHKPLREIVYEELKIQIMTGQIVPGTRMMEVELAEEMGVSRTPIREAIRKLEKEGMVTIEPRRGTYASDISVEDIIDTLDVREVIEGLAAQLASQNITEKEYQHLLAISDEYNAAITSGIKEEIIRLDEEFHTAIMQLSRNKTLIQIGGTIQEKALRFRYLFYDDFSRCVTMPEEHLVITEAIYSGNGELAREKAAGHVHHLVKFIREQGEGAFSYKK